LGRAQPLGQFLAPRLLTDVAQRLLGGLVLRRQECIEVLLVVVIVGEGRVDLGQGQLRVCVLNLFRRQPLLLVARDEGDLDACPLDARLPICAEIDMRGCNRRLFEYRYFALLPSVAPTMR